MLYQNVKVEIVVIILSDSDSLIFLDEILCGIKFPNYWSAIASFEQECTHYENKKSTKRQKVHIFHKI
jgi:hypothetical protein